MKKNCVIVLLLTLCSLPLMAKSRAIRTDSIARTVILGEMERHPKAWQIDNPKSPKWNYTQGLEVMGMLRWADTLGMKQQLLRYAETYTDTMVQQDGSILHYRVQKVSLDGINSGKILFELYEQTHKQKYRMALDTLRKQLSQQPRVAEGGFWHKGIYPHQMWLDGLYMEAPFYAEYATRYERGARQDSSYDDIVNQFVTCYKHTWCDSCHLLHHGWDERGDSRWADAITGRSAHAWGRAEGWYMMALVDAMEWLPMEKRTPLIQQLQTLAASLLSLQRHNGSWQQVLDCPDAEGNYEEMSVTPMLAYAMMKGCRMGWLGREYQQAGMKAVEGICTHYLYNKEGEQYPSLHQICAVAGLSDNRDGSLAYYLHEKVVDNDPKGIGPLLLALLEYHNISCRR